MAGRGRVVGVALWAASTLAFSAATASAQEPAFSIPDGFGTTKKDIGESSEEALDEEPDSVGDSEPAPPRSESEGSDGGCRQSHAPGCGPGPLSIGLGLGLAALLVRPRRPRPPRNGPPRDGERR